MVMRVLEKGQERALLAAVRAPELAASAALLATGRVARDRFPVVTQRFASAPQRGVVCVGHAVEGVDTHPPFGDLETLLIGRRRDAYDAVLFLPLVEHVCRGAQRVTPVHDRPSAQARTGQHDHPEVRGGQQTAAQEELRRHLRFHAGEVGLVEVVAHLEDDDVGSGGGELGRDDRSAGPRTDHDDVGCQFGVLVNCEGPDRLRCRARRLGWAGRHVIDRRPVRICVTARGRRIEKECGRAFDRLEGLAQHRDPAGGQSPQRALALLWAQVRKPARASIRENAEKRTAENRQQPAKLRACLRRFGREHLNHEVRDIEVCRRARHQATRLVLAVDRGWTAW